MKNRHHYKGPRGKKHCYHRGGVCAINFGHDPPAAAAQRCAKTLCDTVVRTLTVSFDPNFDVT